MQFTISAAALLAFAAKAFAQTADFDPIFKPDAWQAVPAGQSFQITWDAPAKYAGQKVTISLIGGDSQNTQVPIKDIATGINNDAEAYNWAVDADLGDKNVYGLVIKLESNPDVFQYSNPFKISASEEKPTEDKPTEEKPSYDKPTYGDDEATTTLTAQYGAKTVSVSSIYQAPPATTIIPVVKTETVPCNTTVPVATKVHTIVEPCNGNCTHPTGAPVPPVYSQPPVHSQPPVVPTAPAQPQPPVVTPNPTPVPEVPVSGAARFGAASVAVIGGLVMAAFAL